MPDFLHAIQTGSTSLWLFIPSAILLGALHGLEPGHSKTVMASFIVAIRGTIGQAVLLGLSAAISHSLIIWLLAAAALRLGSQWNAETVEPYLQMGSAVTILMLAAWMFLRTRREIRDAAQHHHQHDHDHGHGSHPHSHAHEHAEAIQMDSGCGILQLSVFEIGVPPVFRLHAERGAILPEATTVSLETVRPDGVRQRFLFVAENNYLQSTEAIPEPHEFDVVLTADHKGSPHISRGEFHEDSHHNSHAEFQDAHEKAHAVEIEKRFAGQSVTTGQIIMFGITGGLMPCPAAFTVLLVCLQLKKVSLGFAMVGAFSFGLALTMVATGAVAAWSVQHAARRFSGFGEVMRRAPYVSCVLLVILASYMGWHGWNQLQ